MTTQFPDISNAVPWELTAAGWCAEADSYEHQQLISATPVLYELAKALAGTEGVWADEWLNQLARRCSEAVTLADTPRAVAHTGA